MSRDNVIAVAKYKNKYYVLADLNIENQFNKNYIKYKLDNLFYKYTFNRGKALCIAHDIQYSMVTEYGVIEIDIN